MTMDQNSKKNANVCSTSLDQSKTHHTSFAHRQRDYRELPQRNRSSHLHPRRTKAPQRLKQKPTNLSLLPLPVLNMPTAAPIRKPWWVMPRRTRFPMRHEIGSPTYLSSTTLPWCGRVNESVRCSSERPFLTLVHLTTHKPPSGFHLTSRFLFSRIDSEVQI